MISNLMGEIIHTPSIEQEAGFEEPEPPSSKLTRITSLLDAAWDKYLTTTGDKTAIIDDLYSLTVELRQTFAEYTGLEQDLPMNVQTALMVMRKPVLPSRPLITTEIAQSFTVETTRKAIRAGRSLHLGQNVTERAASLRARY